VLGRAMEVVAADPTGEGPRSRQSSRSPPEELQGWCDCRYAVDLRPEVCRTKTISQLRDNRTLLDCQCVCTALASAYQRDGRDIGNEPDIWYATTSMSVEYLRPNPIDSTVQLRAQVVATEDRATSVECVLGADEEDRSRPTVRGVRGPDDWRHDSTR
jgi:hypothetical protein